MAKNGLKLTKEELSISLQFIEREGYSYYFPHLFEFEALSNFWDKISEQLCKIDFFIYDSSPSRKIYTFKESMAIRPIDLLDPIDLIIYTALVFRLAPLIEKKRIPRAEGRIHSFRYSVNELNIPIFENSWENFNEKIKELSKEKVIAKADIADFFPRIYHHRLENALTDITGKKDEIKVLMKFLKKWSGDTSYGIPIGPHASNILAEALLIEVDNYLLSYNLDFIRYIDDYYFFCENPIKCREALARLAIRLDNTQCLTLNGEKSFICSSDELFSMLETPRIVTSEQSKRIIQEIQHGDPYAEIDYTKLTKKQKELIDKLDFEENLKNSLTGDIIDIRSVRFILNTMTALQKPELIEIVMDNLKLLGPVSKTTVRFFKVFDDLEESERWRIGKSILEYIEEKGKEESINEFQKSWLLQIFVESDKWNNEAELRRIAREDKDVMTRRQAILALGNIGERSSLLDLKSRYSDLNRWEKRAVLYAIRSLPKDERNHFYRSQDILPSLKKLEKVDWSPNKRQNLINCSNILDAAIIYSIKQEE